MLTYHCSIFRFLVRLCFARDLVFLACWNHHAKGGVARRKAGKIEQNPERTPEVKAMGVTLTSEVLDDGGYTGVWPLGIRRVL